MAIALRGSNKGTAASATTQTVSLSGVQQGDLVVAALSYSVTGFIPTPPSGWDMIRFDDGASVKVIAWTRLGASPPTSWNFTTVASRTAEWVIAAYSGTHATSPVSNYAYNTDGGRATTTTAVAPSIRTYAANSWAVRVWMQANVGAITDPAGVTVRQEQNANSRAVQIGDEAIATEGMSGSQSATTSAVIHCAVTLILHPDTASDYPTLYYLNDTLVSPTANNHYSGSTTHPPVDQQMGAGGVAGAVGWNMGANTAPRFAYMNSETEVVRTATTAPDWHTPFSASNPSASRGDSFVIGPLTGDLPTKDIACFIAGQQTAASAFGTQAMRFRLFRCDDAAGSNPTQIGSDTDSASVVGAAVQNTHHGFSAHITPAATVTFTGQYLLVQPIWSIVAAASGTGQDYDLRQGTSVVVVPALTTGPTVHTGSAALSGSGAISASGTRIRSGTVPLLGAGTLAATGRKVVAGAAALAGSGTVAASGARVAFGAASLSGSGTLAPPAAGTRVRAGVAAIAGSGALVGTGAHIGVGSTALSGIGTLAASGTRTTTGAASLSGSGTLSANWQTGAQTHSGSASLSGAGTLAATGTRVAKGAASLSGSGALSGSGTRIRGGSAALSGSGTVTAAGTRIRSGAASLSGSGTLSAKLYSWPTGSAFPTGAAFPAGAAGLIGGSADLTGSGTLAATGRATFLGGAALESWSIFEADGTRIALGAASLAGSGSVSASGTRVRAGAASLAGAGTLAAAGAHTGVGAASLAGVGALASSAGTRIVAGSTALSGSGVLDANAAEGVRIGSAALSGTGTLAATGKRVVSGAASFTGSGALAASAKRITSGAASLSGSGALAASGIRVRLGAAALSGAGSLTASGTKVYRGVAALAGAGTLALTGLHKGVGSAALAGGGVLNAAGIRTAVGVAALSGGGILWAAQGTLIVTGAGSFAGLGTLTASGFIGAPPPTAPWRVLAVEGRGGRLGVDSDDRRLDVPARTSRHSVLVP